MFLWLSKCDIWCRGVGSGARGELHKGFGWFDAMVAVHKCASPLQPKSSHIYPPPSPESCRG